MEEAIVQPDAMGIQPTPVDAADRPGIVITGLTRQISALAVWENGNCRLLSDSESATALPPKQYPPPKLRKRMRDTSLDFMAEDLD
jgi:hypothetical protein